MKTSLLCAALMLCAAGARADDLTGRLGVGGTAGAATSFGLNSIENNHAGFASGGWLRYGLRPGWGARLSYDHLAVNRHAGHVDPVLLGLEHNMAPKSDWNPNFHFGVGPAFVRRLALVDGKTACGANFGLGLDRFLTSWFSIGATVDWLPVFKSYPLQKDINIGRVGLLAGFWFGGETGSVTAHAAPARTPGQPKAAVAKVATAAPVPAPAKGGLSAAELAAAAAKLAHPEAVEVTDASRAAETASLQPKAAAVAAANASKAASQAAQAAAPSESVEAASALGTAAAASAVAQARPKRSRRHKAEEDEAAAASGAGAASPAAAPLKVGEAYADPSCVTDSPTPPRMLQEITAKPNEVRIELDKPGPFHTMFAEHPLRLVTDLLCVKHMTQHTYQPTDSRCLVGVRSDQYQRQPFPIVRAVLDLRCPIVYHTKWEGNTLVIAWQDKADAAQAEAADASQSVPAAQAASPSAPRMLQGITAQPNEVRIELDKPGPFHSTFAEHPLRLIMDLLDVKYVTQHPYEPKGSRCLEGVRSDQYQTQPFPIVRAVLDLRCPIVYHTKWDGNTLVITWQDKVDDGEPAQTKQP